MYAILKKHLPKLLWASIIAEALILLAAWWQSGQDIHMAFRIAARLSGRLSLICFALYIIHALYHPSLQNQPAVLQEKWVLACNFAVVHVIHLFILITAIELNHTAPPFLRMLPGIITYSIIILTPFVYRGDIFPKLSLVIAERAFVAAAGLLFLFTYIARISGKSSFATGSGISYIIFGVLTVALLTLFTLRKYLNHQQR